MVGVVFFSSGSFLHCGLTDGTWLIDAWPGVGITRRLLPPHGEIVWLDPDEGLAAWQRAHREIGAPFGAGCAAFVCRALGHRCLLPSALRASLRRA